MSAARAHTTPPSGGFAFAELAGGTEWWWPAHELRQLRAIEQEIERQWRWLIDALNVISRARAEEARAHAFRLMQHQAIGVGQTRIEVRRRIAELVGPLQTDQFR